MAGQTRFDTARLLAGAVRDLGAPSDLPADAPDAYVASVSTFAHALAISGVAGRTGTPILLTEASHPPQETIAALNELNVRRTVVLGGEAVVDADSDGGERPRRPRPPGAVTTELGRVVVLVPGLQPDQPGPAPPLALRVTVLSDRTVLTR